MSNEKLGAEQGRARKVKFKTGDVVMLFADVETSLSNGDYALKTEGGNHIAESARNLYQIESSAPDHAREGALHDRVVAMRDALKPYLRESLRPEQILAIDVAIQAELERALANGKEGGEVFVEHAKKCVKCWATLRKDSRDAPCAEGAKLLAQSICEAAFGADGKEGGE